MNDSKSGVGLGVAAYLCWGFFPLYWPLLDPAGSLEILAHRFVWSMLFVLVLITVMGRWAKFRAIWHDRRSGDWWNAGYLIMWGSNLPVTRTPDAHWMTEARYRGQKVIAVAPDYADNVKFADEWLAARPGTDGALAMSMGHSRPSHSSTTQSYALAQSTSLVTSRVR